ncbi:MAG: phosphoglycerate dehydrogenase [Gemmatimonadetes bacterium]|nr:phosphoglycerate dehydrogenase [Gemmatimonadota bacterium]
MQKILIADSMADGWQEIVEGTGIEVDVDTGHSEEELVALIPEYAGVIVRSTSTVTAPIIEAGKNLRIIGRAGAGVDNINIDAATQRGIIVVNAPGGNTISTADHTMAMLLSLSRNIPQAAQSMNEGRWDRKSYTGVELDGKVLGVMGVGRVGLQVCARARAFGMTVMANDPFFAEEMAEKNNIILASKEEIFSKADYISLHAPLLKETHHLINDDTLAQCKDGVRIVNCARGELIDDAALARALDAGKVAGAAIDVYHQEPPPEDHPLIGRGDVICTPHLAASTAEAQEKVARQIMISVVDGILEKPVQGAINLPSVDPTIFEAIQPYLLLGERMGALVSQLSDGSLEKMNIEYQGEVLEYATSPMTAAVLKGAVSSLTDEPVSFVNAPIFARERGVKIEETRTTSNPDYVNLITVNCETSKESTTVIGTVFGRNDPRLLRIDQFEVKAKIEGDVLICCNKDAPGVVGTMGTLLAENGINIADMALGRESRGGRAIMVFNVDAPVSSEVLRRIEADPLVFWAKHAVF